MTADTRDMSIRDALLAIRFLIATEHNEEKPCDACQRAAESIAVLGDHLENTSLAELSVEAALAEARKQGFGNESI